MKTPRQLCPEDEAAGTGDDFTLYKVTFKKKKPNKTLQLHKDPPSEPPVTSYVGLQLAEAYRWSQSLWGSQLQGPNVFCAVKAQIGRSWPH